MKNVLQKITAVLKTVFGYGIMITLFAGGLTFFGYIIAMFIGGETATAICVFIYEKVFKVIIYTSTIMILLGIVSMYLSNEKALTADKKKRSKEKTEA